MDLIQLTEHCFYLPHTRDTDRPALGYIRGGSRSLGVDAGNSAAHFRLIESAVRKAGLPAVSLLTVTHSHWDHTYALHAVPCPTYAEARTQMKLTQMSYWLWTPEAMQERLRTREDIAFCHDCIVLEYPDLSQIRVAPTDHTFDEQLDLALGGVTVRLMHWPSSHAEDCAVAYVPEDRVLYLGDICYEDLHHDPVCLHKRRFQQLLDRLEACDFALCVPGHQPPMTKAELLSDLRDFLASPDMLVLDD